MSRKFLLILSTLALLCFAYTSNAQNYFSQSFDGTTFAPSGWSVSIGSGSYNWQRTTGVITYPTAGTNSGPGNAGYNSYNASPGSYADMFAPSYNPTTYSSGSDVISFWIYRYNDYGYNDKVVIKANTSASRTGATTLGTVNVDKSLGTSSVSADGWYQYSFTVPSSFSSSSAVYIILEAVSDYGYDTYIDDVSMDHYTPCSGLPAISISRQPGVCSGRSFTLTATGPSPLTGVGYRWQSSSSATGPWTSITGATGQTYTTSITTTTYFRALDTCRTSGYVDSSIVDTVTINPTSKCPCIPTYYYTPPCTSGMIASDSLPGYSGTKILDNSFACNANGYYDHQTVDSVKLQQGATYTGNVTFSYGYYMWFQIWIDFNDDGVFSSSEAIISPIGQYCCTAYTTSYNYTFTLPYTATVGSHIMRIRGIYDYASTETSLDPCNASGSSGSSYYYGSAIDHKVIIIAAPACSAAPTVSIARQANVCSGISFTLKATAPIASGQGFQWQSSTTATGPWTSILGANGLNYTTSITSKTFYRFVDTCRTSGTLGISNVDTVDINPAALCPCIPTYYYTSPCTYTISSFSITGYSGTSIFDGALACNTSGYYDRTFDTVKLQQGNTYSGNVTMSYGYYMWYQIWIDYNDDGVFSTSEKVVGPIGQYCCVSYTTSWNFSLPVPFTAVAGPHRMRVRAIYDYNGSQGNIDPCASNDNPSYPYYYGSTRDFVANIIAAPPCTGTPTISVTPAGPIAGCSGTSTTLNAVYAAVKGQSFIWQTSTDGGITWSNIAGATNTTYTFTITASAYYRLVDTCQNSGLYAYSNIVVVNLKSAGDCPCTPVTYYQYASCSYYNYIQNVTITGVTTLSDNPPCPTTTYVDRTDAVAAVKMNQGSTYTGQFYTYKYYGQASVWIDFNDDGTFATTERVAYPTYYGTCCSIGYLSLSLAIPATATPGVHRMRIRNVYACCSAPSTIDPCTASGSGYTYYYGEAVDYYANILSTVATPTVSPAGTVNSCITSGGNLTLTASSAAASPTYTWTGPSGSTFTSSGNTATIPQTFANTGIYKVTVTSGGVVSAPAIDTVFFWPYPVFANASGVTSNSPVCTPNPITLNGSANPSNATYSWSGPGGYTSTSATPVISPSTTANTGTYTVTVSNHGCNLVGSTSVTVYQTPAVTSNSLVNPTTCVSNNGSITLNGLNASSTYSVSYTKNGGGTITTSITSNASGQVVISGLSAGIYNNIKLTLNGCPSAPVGPLTLNNPSTPATPVASSNSPVCLNSTLSFNATDATPGVTYTWTGPAFPSGTSVQNPSVPNVPFADSGNYFVYVTDALSCTSSIVTVNVVVKPLPANPTASSNTPVCQGSTLSLTSSSSTAGATYSWTGPNSFTSTAQNPNINNVQLNAIGTYTVYSVLNGCNSAAPATTNVYVKWTPGTPSLSSNSPVCNGAGYNPNVLTFNTADTSGGVTYTWSGPNAFSVIGSTATTQTIINPPFVDSGVYSIYATLNGCNSAVTTTRVVINPTPVKPAVNPSFTAYCQYAPVTVALTATGTALRWYTASTGGVSSTVAPVPKDSVAGLNTWYVTQTIGGCESQPGLDSVLIKTKPQPPYFVDSAFVYCQADIATTLRVIGVNTLWYTSATGGVGNPVPPTPSTVAAGITTYYASQTVNGCESDRFRITVTVKVKPAPPAVNPVIYCQGNTPIPLSAGGANLLWFTTSSGGVGSPVAPTPITSYSDTVYYYVSQTVNGCQSDRAKLMVVVNYTPNALIVASQPFVCQHDTMSFSYFGNAKPDASYDWALPQGASLISGGGQGPLVVRFDSFGRQSVLLVVTNHGCHSASVYYTVDVHRSPIIPIVIKNDVCQGEVVNVSLGYANEHVDKYVWSFDGADTVYSASGGGPYGLRWHIPGPKVVQLIAYTSDCPSLPERDTVNVHPLADAHIGTVSNSSICAGDSINFTAENYNAVNLYQWMPAVYFGDQTNLGQVHGFIGQSGYVKLMVTTQFGCTSVDSTLIMAQPCCDMYFPNAFTPNGDGKNDFFRPITQGAQEIKTFRVTSRWGQVVFETVDRHAGWDGKKGGVPQDLGTYYYYIKYVCANGKTYEQKGEVVLLR
ncbi:MAG: gliding motility-associated C-terminal domain-containing protein [Taibaiella sp.]|nr:gliding motility-associated C-terminal domain-containing protein [Taibaiella sp.]